jgi:hypothetical protein
MRILEYIGLDTSRVAKTYRKVIDAIAADDFRAAQVKKLSNLNHGKFYRARLDDTNRLLFSLVRHQDEVCALILEVIANHDYDKSRFLRGAIIDETKIPDCDATEAANEALPLRYLHPEHGKVHLLDKPISFDDAQEAIYRQPAPLIVVGGAGSGKTALTLEKLKHAEGETLYVTHSAYLAQSARDLYYANGFEHPGQEATFLSYREFVETLHVPPGREAQWRDFAGWFARMKQAFRDIDAHQAYEEIRGVLAAGADGILTRDAYRELGIRQSIFPAEQRDTLYDLFEKYRAWLAEAKLYDLNLIAQDWLPRAQPRYDFVLIDEIQDITPVQLSLVLRTVKKPGHFLLCGDSNQIVHPNFFSWSQVKQLFWRDPALAERQELRVLAANFRNGLEATRVANQLLKIKQRRFGSIDRESNYLVRAVGGEPGRVNLLPAKDPTKNELDQHIRKSPQFAVLVMRDEDKAEARKHFSTPLLFSITKPRGSNTKTSCSTASSPTTAPNSLRSSTASTRPISLSKNSTTGAPGTRATNRSKATSSTSTPSTSPSPAASATFTSSNQTRSTRGSACSTSRSPDRSRSTRGNRRSKTGRRTRASSNCRASRNRPTPSATTCSGRRRCPGPCSTKRAPPNC